MRIIRAHDYDDMSRIAANIIFAHVRLKSRSVLGLATGSSPVGTYKKLIRYYKNGDISFSSCHTVNLDEYIGLTPDNRQSYAFFMRDNFFSHVDFKPENLNIPNGMAENIQAECERYDGLINSLGGIDLQLLGIGHNGHIGFNEPGPDFVKGTHSVPLTSSTIEANSRFFEPGEYQPDSALTMGIMNIMSAGSVLLLACGKEKAEILRRSLCGDITPQVQASILQLHPDLTVVADKGALSLIPG